MRAAFGFEYKVEETKAIKPILSEDQYLIIEEAIRESYANKIKIKLSLYNGGNISSVIGIVNQINRLKEKIILNNNKQIYFKEIIEVKKID